MTKYKRFTKSDLQFIVDNYPKIGLKKCANKLCKSTAAVSYQIRKLNIPKVGKIKKAPHEYKVNPLQFSDPSQITKESAYILGLLWADGFLNDSGRSYRICIECIKSDIDKFFSIFLKTGKWTIHFRKRKNRQPTGTIQTNNESLYKFLFCNGYNAHNSGPADIINIIPNNLRRFFMLGLIDGDGCFYYDNKNKTFSITSCYDQNWEPIIKYLKYNNIKCKIYRYKRKNDKLSHLKIIYKDGIKDLFNLIYSDRKNHKLGLERKYQKCIELLNSYKR